MFVFGTSVSEDPRPRVERDEDARPAGAGDSDAGEDERLRGLLPQVFPRGAADKRKRQRPAKNPRPRRQLLQQQQQRGGAKQRPRRLERSAFPGRNAATGSQQARRKYQREQIEDLVAEERAVLEQLEATRARLRAKLESSPDYQVIRALTDSSPPQRVSTNQQLDPAANTRTENVLPALTNVGDRAFEAGLRDGQHVLPIFQLPAVSRDAPISNPLPREPSDEERERLQAELDARKRAQVQLGLTEDEINYFDALVKKSPRDPTALPLPLPLPLPASQTHASDAPQPGRRRRKAPHGAKRSRRRDAQRGAATSSRNSATLATPPADTALALRKELSTSIKSVQSLTGLVQDGVAALQREYPGVVRNAKSKTMVQRWGAAKLDQFFRKRDRARIHEAVQKWQLSARWGALEEKHMVYQMMQGAGKVAHIVSRIERAKLAAGMRKWVAVFDFERNNEEFVAMSKASLVIQRCWRGHRGRLHFAACKLRKEMHEQHTAAAKLQSIFRGRQAKTKVSGLREKQILHRAARKTQTAFRSRLARKRADERRARLEAENFAALKLQTAWRRKHGQMAYHLLRRARRDQAASRMQALQRKRLAKRKADAMRVHQRRERACLMVQRAYRSRLARKRMAARRIEFAQELEIKERCALRLQAVYRGHRGRLVFQLKNHAKRAALEQDAQQINKIQSLFRGKMGRRKAATRRKEYLEEMCEWARSWAEEFDETSNDYVFRNLYTHEVLTEPPPEGYTKRDGMLALLDGRVLEDPAIVAKREHEQSLLQCIECDEAAATRKCAECDDIYCDDCFDAIHLKGALASHAYEWFQDGGPPQSQEQSRQLSAPLAAAQQQADAAGADWVELFDEESGYPYWYDQTTGVTTWEMPPELAEQYGSDAQAQQQGVAEASEEWATYYDEASGQNYLYNATTGECIWETDQQGAHQEDDGHGTGTYGAGGEVVYDEETGYPVQEQHEGYY